MFLPYRNVGVRYLQMDTIYSFKDHPQLKQEKQTRLYFLNGEFYFATNRLHLVELLKLSYTNMGEPFRELARLTFTFKDCKLPGQDQETESIDIVMKDAARLVYTCANLNVPLSIAAELNSQRSFLNELEDLNDPETP